tara:strand:- start:972 stop:1184 length:213 start_codon:yes stop_codon:yes gene_type:complete
VQRTSLGLGVSVRTFDQGQLASHVAEDPEQERRLQEATIDGLAHRERCAAAGVVPMALPQLCQRIASYGE